MRLTIWVLIVLCVILLGCQEQITSFEECVAAGNPVLESYPRQCNAQGNLFVENVTIPTPETVHFQECSEQEKQAQVCTQQYDPVCGLVDNDVRCVTTPCPSLNAVTFSNSCSACSEQAQGYYNGACEDQLFVVCQETVTGFDPQEYASQNSGICVEVCPGNYDGYVTQIGIELCIKHYGIQEIEQWPLCERSSESCDCVKAYETTQGEPIDDPQYRCVPSQYAERLLFRAGVDRLDEEGQQSIVIA